MAVTPALMTSVPYLLPTFTGTGAVPGSAVAIPPAGSRAVERFLTVQIHFSADPGVYVFNLMGSLDGGTTWTLIDTTNVSGTTSDKLSTIRTNVPLVRLDQVSKANSVTATVNIMVE